MCKSGNIMELRNPLFGGLKKEDEIGSDDSYSVYSKKGKPLKFDKTEVQDELASLI